MRLVTVGFLVLSLLLLSACTSPKRETRPHGPAPDLSGAKAYLLAQSEELVAETKALQQAASQYYDLARAHQFDYAALWSQEPHKARAALNTARQSFLKANPAYELMEGIVAGVDQLAQFDVDLDAGIAASEGTEDVVSFDVTLPDGQVLAKPGNFFFLAEATLWGTRPEWTAQQVSPDLDGDGQVAFGEVLPDANVLKGVADAFASKSGELLQSARAWEPSEADAYTALVVMIPTMDEYFGAWKESRYVAGDQATSLQFVAASRLQDIVDILTGLQVVYGTVKPSIAAVDAAQASQTEGELKGLREYVLGILAREKAGHKFSAEEADLFGGEAQQKATAIAGQIAQAAAKVGVSIDE